MEKEAYSKLQRKVDDLMVGFNMLLEEVRSIKSHLSKLDESLLSLKSYVNGIQDMFDFKIASTKAYARIVSKIEASLSKHEENY